MGECRRRKMGQNQNRLAGKVIQVVLIVLITLGCNSQEPVGLPFTAASDGAYGKLFARDAQVRALPSWMEATDSAIRLRVVDAEAAYPIVIDSLLITDQGKLLPSDGLPGDRFGISLAVDGDTAIVGADATGTGTSSGAAYVFVRTGDVWTEQAKLVPSDGLLDGQFGYSVALDGDTAVVGA